METGDKDIGVAWVAFSSRRNKWLVKRKEDRKTRQLGSFNTEEEALEFVRSLANQFTNIILGGVAEPKEEEGEHSTTPPTFPLKEEGQTVLTVKVCKHTAKALMESDLSDTARRQALYFLSLLPMDGSSRKLDSKLLEQNLPQMRRIAKFLVPEYVQKGQSYRAGHTCKEWSYVEPPEHFTSATIRDKRLMKKLANWKLDRARRNLRNHRGEVGTDWLIQSLGRVSAGYFAQEMMERRGIEMPSEQSAKVTAEGRISHGFSSFPSGIRLNLLIDGEDVADVDMSKSQMCILAALWTRSLKERSRLQELIADGTIYSRMEFAFEQDRENIERFNASAKDKDKITTTKQLLNKVFMGFQNSDWYSFKQMELEFPQLMKSICSYKWKMCKLLGTSKASLSAFARKLQKEEAMILAKVAEKLEPLDIPAVPIFDGILVPDSKAELVQGFFEEVLFERLGFVTSPTVTRAGDEVYASAIC
jgi:hypothetical protein